MHDKKNYEKYVYINFPKLKKKINIKKGNEYSLKYKCYINLFPNKVKNVVFVSYINFIQKIFANIHHGSLRKHLF